MQPLNKLWLDRYHRWDNVVYSALNGYDYKRCWLGAWYLMRDYQNTEVCKSSNIKNDMR